VATLLLIEATLLDADPGEPAGHLSAGQAGAIGRRAGVGRLVLTHFSDQLDPTLVRSRAQAAFGRMVDLAGEGETYEI
jgi:ribonuclease BN (tRNA processing enzyme)